MANFVSFDRFDLPQLDLNWYDRNGYQYQLDKSANISFNGTVYPDAYYLDADDHYDNFELTLLGTNLSVDAVGNVTGGTANLIGEYDLKANRISWYAEGISVSATAAYNAVLTSSGADDTAVLAAALSGNDSLTLSPFDDRMSGFDGNDTITGGSGYDTLTGGAGADVFFDTAAGLNGDTITDFSLGDRIRIANASLPGFTFALTGNTLTYTGGSLTLENLPVASHLVATAAADGGVNISLSAMLDNGATGDFNGDGRDDILWRNSDGRLSDWLGKTNGGFTSNDANALAQVAGTWSVAGVGDFNGDGREDILWRNANGQLSDWLSKANGGFTNNDANAFTSVSTSWNVAATGDFNGDGRDDILWRNSDGRLSDWLGQTNGGFVNNDAHAASQVSTAWTVVGAADFNGDGRDDILWRNSDGRLSDWLGQTNGGFTNNDANALASVPQQWHVVGTGDFNGDGREDILWRNENGQISDWLGQANGRFTVNDAAALTQAPTNWQIVGTGDYNGDGRADILWRSDTGGLSDWLATANGGFASNDANALVQVATDWQVQIGNSFVV